MEKAGTATRTGSNETSIQTDTEQTRMDKDRTGSMTAPRDALTDDNRIFTGTSAEQAVQEADPQSRFRRIIGSSRDFFGNTIGLAIDRTQEFLSGRNISARKIAAAGGIGALAASAFRTIRHRREEAQNRDLSTRIRRRIPFGRH